MKKLATGLSLLMLANSVIVPQASAQNAGAVARDVFGTIGGLQQRRQAQLPPATLRMNPRDMQRYNSADAAYNKTVAQGALLGGVLGVVICKAIVDTDNLTAAGCGLIGGAVGAVVGDGIGKKSKELIEDRAKIDSALNEAKANRASATKLLEATNKNVTYLEAQVKSYNAKYKAGTITQAQYQSEMQAARGHLSTLNEGVDKVNDQMKKQKKLFEKMEKRAGKSEDPDVIAAKDLIAQEKDATSDFLEGQTVTTASKISTVEGMLGA